MGIVSDIAERGFAVLPNVIPFERIASLREVIPPAGRGGVRNLFGVAPELRALAEEARVREIVAQVLGSEGFVTRAILFDKSPSANWTLGFHQDLFIAVKEMREAPGFGPWSEKDGVPHVRPPVEVLEEMITVRIHVDDCPETNAPLRCIPGSHRHGFLSEEAIRRWEAETPAVTCCARAGDAVLMRPLVLHASSKQQQAGHRRIVHLEFASEPLPGGLGWARA